MSKSYLGNNSNENISLNLNSNKSIESKGANYRILMKRVRDIQQKKNKENFFFAAAIISVFVISGIVISF